MNTIEVLRYGTQVRMTFLDPYSFNGRENHPSEADVGFVGIVVANQVDLCDEEHMLYSSRANVLGGVEVPKDPDGDFAWICYKVRASDGRELDLMDHEIEVFS